MEKVEDKLQNLITVELLSEVLGFSTHNISETLIHNELCYWKICSDNEDIQETINIHELAHKCKEWAYNKMYFLSSGYDTDGAFCLDRCNNKSFIAKTEQEAIIKATLYVMEQNNETTC